MPIPVHQSINAPSRRQVALRPYWVLRVQTEVGPEHFMRFFRKGGMTTWDPRKARRFVSPSLAARARGSGSQNWRIHEVRP